MTCSRSLSNLESEQNQNLSPQHPLECHQYLSSRSHQEYSSLPGHTAVMWEVLLVQIFDEGAETGGGCIAFCLISSSITLIDLPVLANTEKLACLGIFHCITMLPINPWISTVLLPLEKDASGGICILSAALQLFSGRGVESSSLPEDGRRIVVVIMCFCCAHPYHDTAFCLKGRQEGPGACL